MLRSRARSSLLELVRRALGREIALLLPGERDRDGVVGRHPPQPDRGHVTARGG
ncbi:MAG TPA: hypothetical protein VHN18_06845 [Micromonosporaceae bacterium]|nr:hypothetical protein [Micromonosporaceae bacterium]